MVLAHDPFIEATAQLAELRAKTTYWIRVSAVNGVGVGKVSSILKTSTSALEETP